MQKYNKNVLQINKSWSHLFQTCISKVRQFIIIHWLRHLFHPFVAKQQLKHAYYRKEAQHVHIQRRWRKKNGFRCSQGRMRNESRRMWMCVRIWVKGTVKELSWRFCIKFLKVFFLAQVWSLRVSIFYSKI